MIISVFGLGFVGLTTALGFAHSGHRVYGIDIDKERMDQIRKGVLPFYEPHMKDVLADTLDKSFFVTQDLKKAVGESDCIFYCVGTPYGANGCADLTYLFRAIDATMDQIDDEKFRVLIVKSTVPPSTTDEKVAPYIREKYLRFAAQTGIANNPEFLREGHCWDDFIQADRIVLGCEDEKSAAILQELYKDFEIPVYVASRNTGEFIKYLSNTLLATLISFSNEMSLAADHIGGINVAEAFRILHMDKRWNNCQMTSYVYPGCGYGGYCLPKDTSAFYAQAVGKGYEPLILKNVIELNEKMPSYIAQKIISKSPKEGIVGILGLSFKPFTDDVRDTPAAKVMDALIREGYGNIHAFDPVAMDEFKKRYSFPVTYEGSMEDVYHVSDIVVIVTAWPEFKKIADMGDKPIVDCRYML